MKCIALRLAAVSLVLSLISAADSTVAAGTYLKNICRVKGQEENTLQGLGIVIGLKGTGDGGAFLPAIRALATSIELMGSPLGKAGLLELKDAKNVAMVAVTVTVPAAGGRQGDKLDCQVSSVGAAKSLEGGRLFLTALQGPLVGNDRVYAFAEGPVHLDSIRFPTTGRIHGGCRLEEDFINPFTKDDKITLVVDRNHASFQVTQDIADLINNSPLTKTSRAAGGLQFTGAWQPRAAGTELARAINQLFVEVAIPEQYRDDPVLFVSEVLALPLDNTSTEARVVVNQRAGSVIIGADVEIGPAVVTHKNIVIETGDNLPADRFIPIDPAGGHTARLKALVAALNALKVPTEDIIEIIKGLDRDGKLQGKLIVE